MSPCRAAQLSTEEGFYYYLGWPASSIWYHPVQSFIHPNLGPCPYPALPHSLQTVHVILPRGQLCQKDKQNQGVACGTTCELTVVPTRYARNNVLQKKSPLISATSSSLRHLRLGQRESNVSRSAALDAQWRSLCNCCFCAPGTCPLRAFVFFLSFSDIMGLVILLYPGLTGTRVICFEGGGGAGAVGLIFLAQCPGGVRW